MIAIPKKKPQGVDATTSRGVFCPWCEKGQVFVEGSGKVHMTVRFPKCQHCYRINLLTMEATKVAAYK